MSKDENKDDVIVDEILSDDTPTIDFAESVPDNDNVPIEDVDLEGKKRRFYMNAKHFFLTYSDVPEVWTKEYVKKELDDVFVYKKNIVTRGRSRIKAYIIAEERHQAKLNDKSVYERGKKHFHCYLELYSLYEINSARMLDIIKDKQDLTLGKIKGNYQKVKSVWGAIKYCKKENNYISDGLYGCDVVIAKPVKSDRAYDITLDHVMGAKTDEDAALMLAQMGKLSGKDIRHLRAVVETTKQKETIVKEIATTRRTFEFMTHLLPNHDGAGVFSLGVLPGVRPMGLLAYGETEAGKTTLGFKIAASIGWSGIITVTDPREMSEHYNDEQIIVLDEMTKGMFELYSQWIARIITEHDAKTLPYNTTRQLKWPRKVIITTNENVSIWVFTPALRSRLILVQVFRDGRFIFQRVNADGFVVALSEIEISNYKNGISQNFVD